MESARAIYLGGKVIYANDKRLNNNSYIEWGLYCPECGEEVHLRHGLIREPYFAHFKQITNTECSLRVTIDGNNEGRWTELEIGRGQRRELFQQYFLALVATNDCDFYMKIAKVKDTINSDILLSITKEVRNYLVKNTIEIIESSVQLYRNKSNETKFKALNEKIISEAIEYLCVESSLNVLQQLIYYCISFSEQVVKNDAGNVENPNIVIDLINKVAVIIANTDWTKEIFTLKNHNLLRQNILPPVEETHDNPADSMLGYWYYTIETSKGKYLLYRLFQTSSNPYSVTIQNVGEKTSKSVISLTLMEDSIKVEKLVLGEKADKLPNKYVFKKNGLHLTSHSQVIESIVLPYFLNTALIPGTKNLIAAQWLFISLLCTRLEIQHTSLSDKSTVKPFNMSDMAFALSGCVELAEKHQFPSPIVDMLKADFAQLPEDIRKPFEKAIDVSIVQLKELPDTTQSVDTTTPQTTDTPLDEDVKIDALKDAKLVLIDVNGTGDYVSLLTVLEHYLVQFYDRENSEHNYYYDVDAGNGEKLVAFLVPGKKKDVVKAFMPYKEGVKHNLELYLDDDGDIQSKKNIRINWKGVLLTAVSALPSKLKQQFLNCPIALYKYLSANCPLIPSSSYLVPSYVSIQAIRDVVKSTIDTLVNRVQKLQIQVDFWKNDQHKQLELVNIKRKLRLNKRLLTVFAGKRDTGGKVLVRGLVDRLAAIPDEPSQLETWFKRFNRQYLFAVTANMALVKKLPVIPCLLGSVTDEKWVNLITSFQPELERVTQYDLTVINSNAVFRGIDDAEVKNGVIKAKAGFMGSALISQVREKINTDNSSIRSAITGNVTLIDRKNSKEKSQTTFVKKQPQLNTDGKTLGQLLNLPPTLYRTTRNLYWLLDTTYQGCKLVETDKTVTQSKKTFSNNGILLNKETTLVKEQHYVSGNSGLIAAIRVSKQADFGYFNIGELFVNAHGQIAYRLPKKSLSFVLENLAIEFSELAEGLSKLGLWKKSNMSSTHYFTGVINRTFQRQLQGGQLDILADHVLYDLGVEIKRFKNEKGEGCYSVKRLLYPKYTN